MKVQEVLLDDNKKRFILLEEDGRPNFMVLKYLKYLDSTGKSSNTQRTYCYALKHYFEYLEDIKKNLKEINFDDLSLFVSWLRNPYRSKKVVEIRKGIRPMEGRTVNLIITVVTNFYDYLYRFQLFNLDVSSNLQKPTNKRRFQSYKGFLYHINKNREIRQNVLKVKVGYKKIKVMTKAEVEQVYEAATNIRDRFLIKLLFETGLRIGEALSLFIEDFVFDYQNGHQIKLKNRGEALNGAKLKTGERTVHISQGLMDLYDDYLYEILDELEIDSNFIFVKLRGKNRGMPMDYSDVSALFKRLRSKTNLKVYAHLFRHTHATMYYRQTKNIKQVQERIGHAHIQTTLKMYLHPSQEEIREEWEKAQHTFRLNINDGEE